MGRGYVIGVGVHMYSYMCMYVFMRLLFTLAQTLSNFLSIEFGKGSG